jgi:hypothetical protein
MRNPAISEQAGSTVAVSRGARPKISQPWWQWPNLLALDAPVVAVVWLHAFSKATGEAMQWPVATGLFLAVWCIYLADRLIDARCLNDPARASARHRFALQNWRCLLALLAVSGLWAAWLASTMIDAELLRAASTLLVAVVLYFSGFVRKTRSRPSQILPAKEVVCGLVFAIGCALGVRAFRESPIEFLPMALSFGGVCAFNCLLISAWEKSSDQINDPASASHWWTTIDRDLGWIGVVLTATCTVGTFTTENSAIFLAISGSSALLTVLHLSRSWMNVTARRVLADAVLLTPLMIAIPH